MMIHLPDIRPPANCLLLIAALCLSACTIGPWERDFWHPPAATGIAPISQGPVYPLRRAGGSGEAWPNLADVPARSTPPLSPEQAQQQLGELAAQRDSSAPSPTPGAHDDKLRIPTTPPPPVPELWEEVL